MICNKFSLPTYEAKIEKALSHEQRGVRSVYNKTEYAE